VPVAIPRRLSIRKRSRWCARILLSKIICSRMSVCRDYISILWPFCCSFFSPLGYITLYLFLEYYYSITSAKISRLPPSKCFIVMSCVDDVLRCTRIDSVISSAAHLYIIICLNPICFFAGISHLYNLRDERHTSSYLVLSTNLLKYTFMLIKMLSG